MDVVFLGTPAFAVPTLEAILATNGQNGHRIVGVVTQPDRPRGRGGHSAPPPVRVAAEAHDLEVLQTADVNDPTSRAWLEAKSPHVGVVVAFGQFLKRAVREIPRHGLINLHASLLPKFRGAAPIHGSIMAGDAETGVSVMQVERRLDAGPVFATCAVPIGPDETTGELEVRLAALGAPMVVEVLDQLSKGSAHATPQDDAAATHIGRLTAEDRDVKWSNGPHRVHDQVRGLTPHPGAITTFEADGGASFSVRITVTRPIVPAATALEGGDVTEPGELLAADEGRLHVRTGDGGVIEVVRLVPAGSREMDGVDFLRGRGRDGGRFTSR